MTSAHLDRIHSCFPDLIVRSIEVGDGLINDVLLVNDELVFRFPKNSRAQQSLAKERLILELVCERVDVRVPAFQQAADDFVVYDLIPGDALQALDIHAQAPNVKERLMQQLATFLRQLHTIPTDELRNIPRSDAARSPDHWLEMFTTVEQEVFPLLWNHQKNWVRRLFEPVLSRRLDMNYEPVLIHGDLAPYHILWDSDRGQVNGVIDFGTSGLGDPACDFAAMIREYGEPFLRGIAKHYPDIRLCIDRARFRSAVIELEWALNGIRSRDSSWFVAHIGSARDIMPLGTPWT